MVRFHRQNPIPSAAFATSGSTRRDDSTINNEPKERKKEEMSQLVLMSDLLLLLPLHRETSPKNGLWWFHSGADQPSKASGTELFFLYFFIFKGQLSGNMSQILRIHISSSAVIRGLGSRSHTWTGIRG